MLRTLFYILTIIVFGQPCYGQTNNLQLQKLINGDTTFLFNWFQKRNLKAGLKDLTKTKESLHVRFSTERQAIDIWTSDYQTFYGKLTNLTYRIYKDKKERKHNAKKFYSETIALDTFKSKQIFKIFQSKGIIDLPPQDSIEGWGNGFDGITYVIEKSTPSYYSFKSYWTPGAYKDEIDKAKKFYEVIQQLETNLKLNEIFYKFIKTLPKGTYTAGGISLITISKKRKHTRN